MKIINLQNFVDRHWDVNNETKNIKKNMNENLIY